jgi:hypothetical protein
MHTYFVVTPGIGVPNSEANGLTVIRLAGGGTAGWSGTARWSAASGTAGAVGLRPAGAAYEGPPTPTVWAYAEDARPMAPIQSAAKDNISAFNFIRRYPLMRAASDPGRPWARRLYHDRAPLNQCLGAAEAMSSMAAVSLRAGGGSRRSFPSSRPRLRPSAPSRALTGRAQYRAASGADHPPAAA